VDGAALAAAEAWALKLDESALAGQLIIAGIDARGIPSEEESARLAQIRPGAVMLFRKNLASDDRIRAMTAAVCRAVEAGGEGVTPFIACDQEGGAVQRVRGNAWLDAPAAYTELVASQGRESVLTLIEADARRAAEVLSSLGINMNFAPVAEPLTDDNAAFLGERSYGRDAAWVTLAALAFMRGMEAGGAASVIKHFPGHSGADPHEALPVLLADTEMLEARAAPFYAAFARGAPAAVMVAHTLVPAWDWDYGASQSEVILTQKIKAEGAFGGIVIADDFSMAASQETPEAAAVRAIAAGADMVMAWPKNLSAVHRALLEGLAGGALSHERMRDAARRVIYQKIRFGLLSPR
jgi:beta-N-acetylhexosaminidase